MSRVKVKWLASILVLGKMEHLTWHFVNFHPCLRNLHLSTQARFSNISMLWPRRFFVSILSHDFRDLFTWWGFRYKPSGFLDLFNATTSRAHDGQSASRALAFHLFQGHFGWRKKWFFGTYNRFHILKENRLIEYTFYASIEHPSISLIPDKFRQIFGWKSGHEHWGFSKTAGSLIRKFFSNSNVVLAKNGKT